MIISGVFLSGIVLAAAYLAPLPRRLAVRPSTVVTFADGTPAYVFLSPDDKYRVDVRPAEVDPDYLRALLRFEDKRFRRHPGVDPLAVLRSALANLRHGRVVSGASTITMQLVRLLEPRPRTLAAKAVEALRALQVELRMSKEEVLAAYLAFLPFGGNVEGVAAASWAYFGHGPGELTAEEIATLLAVPQRPAPRHPAPENAARLRAARNDVAAWLLERDALPLGEGGSEVTAAELLAQVRAAPVPAAMRALPREAPHAAFWLRERHPAALRIETTLERGTQRLAARLMRAARREMALRGIRHGAAVVVEPRTATVRALVGSFDFWADDPGAQIPGFAAPRSPGSALKPLIYALALDRGLALPEHLVVDVPVVYGDYAPDNYDGEFAGLVSLEDALSHSLNVPFVRLLARVGVERFVGTLRTMGAESLRREPGYYGLSAAIGAVEVTPLEVASLYATLAEEGRYRPLRWLRQHASPAPTPLLSPGAAYLTRRALARRDRPDFPHRRRFTGAPAAVHWKTGTSFGHRDAWAAGSDAEHTAVVWLGNFDNAPAFDLVGSEAAGPLLFDLLEALAARARPRRPLPRPPGLAKVEVCADSGHLPTAACPERARAWALRDRVPSRRCPYHVAVDVDLETGLALAPGCRAGRRWETRSYLVWPATVRRYLTARHRWLPAPPSPAPGCGAPARRQPPAILSPPAGRQLVLLPGLDPEGQEVPLQAEAGDGELSWFVDGVFLGTAPAHEELWWTPEPGRHEIVVKDRAGLSARRVLEVRGVG